MNLPARRHHRPLRRTRPAAVAVLATAIVALLSTGVAALPDGAVRAPRSFDSQGPLNAIALWAHGFDADDVDLAMEAFTDDPTFVFTLANADEPLPPFEGFQAVRDLFAGAIADQLLDEDRRHVTTNHLVEQIDPRTARVTSYLTLLQNTSASEDPDVISTGVYTDIVVRGADQIWRIERRELVLDTPTFDDDLTP